MAYELMSANDAPERDPMDWFVVYNTIYNAFYDLLYSSLFWLFPQLVAGFLREAMMGVQVGMLWTNRSRRNLVSVFSVKPIKLLLRVNPQVLSGMITKCV